MAAVVLKALMQESTIELLHPEATAPPSSLLPQPCKVPIRTAVNVTAIEKTLIAEDFIPNQSVVNGANWLS
jgi:hypothetical protein